MKPRVLLEQERFDCLRLARSEQIGPANYRRLIHRFGSAGEALATGSVDAGLPVERVRALLLVSGGRAEPVECPVKAVPGFGAVR